MKKRVRRFPGLTLYLGCVMAILDVTLSGQTEVLRLWEESIPGVIVIEAESVSEGLWQAGAWEKFRNLAGVADGIIWRGPHNTQGGAGIVEYEVLAVAPILRFRVAPSSRGFWRLRLRNHHLKEDGDNDVWVSLNGGAWSKFHDPDVATWTWDNSGFGQWNWIESVPETIYTVELAGRSKGLAIDRLVLHSTRLEEAVWGDPHLTEKHREERLHVGQRYVWSQGADLGAGWRYIPNMGFIFDAHHPWMYQPKLGWLGVFADRMETIFLYGEALDGWGWTSDAMLPYIYRFSDGQWTSFLE